LAFEIIRKHAFDWVFVLRTLIPWGFWPFGNTDTNAMTMNAAKIPAIVWIYERFLQ
jgi:hypothetical protein